jgi:hypothetical protein
MGFDWFNWFDSFGWLSSLGLLPDRINPAGMRFAFNGTGTIDGIVLFSLTAKALRAQSVFTADVRR